MALDLHHRNIAFYRRVEELSYLVQRLVDLIYRLEEVRMLEEGLDAWGHHHHHRHRLDENEDFALEEHSFHRHRLGSELLSKEDRLLASEEVVHRRNR